MSRILNYLLNIAIGSDPSISHAYAHFPVKSHRSISCLKASNILFQRLALSYNANVYAHITWLSLYCCLHRKFIDASLRDIDRFKRQKVKDLKEIFTNYAVMQIKQCKKVCCVSPCTKQLNFKIMPLIQYLFSAILQTHGPWYYS